MTATSEDFDFSDIAEKAEPSESNVLSGSRGTQSTGHRRGRRPVKRLEALQKKLSSEVFQAGSIIGMGLPVTGYFLCQESHDFTTAIVDLASKRVEWVDALEKVADIGPGITIGRTVIGTVAAIGVDRKRVDPERAFLGFLGVYKAYLAVYPQESENGYTTYQPPPAGTFVPVQ